MHTASATQGTGSELPDWLSRATSVGARLFGVAVALVGIAFLTDPSPTKDLPGVGLPVTLPVSQPDFGHSVASYFVGMWLFEFTFPLFLLAAYDHLELSGRRASRLLVGLPTAYMSVLLAYCSLVYVPRVSPAPLGPAATAVCWAFCATGAPLWGGVTAVVAALGVLACAGTERNWTRRGDLAVLFGVLSLPLGIPAIYWGIKSRDGAESVSGVVTRTA